uniref:C-type lectin domain-containing protein n=1 Tax=Haemonchus contortus TaxID=6289 RepID=A0A7I5EA64_HAECO
MMFALVLLVLPVTIAVCPQGMVYRQEFDRCYKFSSVAMPYSMAETDCINLGGHLVSIKNGYENAMLIETAQADRITLPFFIGLTTLGGGLWTWNDNTPVEYLNWASGQPSSGYQCAVSGSPSGIWSAKSCSDKKTYVCAAAPGSSPPTVCPPPPICPPQPACVECPTPAPCPAPPACPSCPTVPVCPAPRVCPTCPATPTCPSPTVIPGHCPSEWTYFASTDSCYKTLFGANFYEAEQSCQVAGSHLASIHSSAEDRFVAGMAKTGEAYTNPNSLTWIGLWQPGYPISIQWTWTDGTSLDYTAWAAGEPNNADGNEHCVQFYSDHEGTDPSKDPQFQKWNDYYCNDAMRAYVCKKPALH